MKHLLLSIFLILLGLTSNQVGASEYNPYLKDRLHPHDRRAPSLALALKLMQERDAKTLVETGTMRLRNNFAGDGGSTVIFGHWASEHDAILYTVDISDAAIANSKRQTKLWASHIRYIARDSIGFLAEFGKSIDFLYLDSFDIDINHPAPSQQHHLQEIMAAYKWLHAKSVVMIDDCALPHGGKGRLVIDYLTERGWKVIFNGYQVVLTR